MAEITLDKQRADADTDHLDSVKAAAQLETNAFEFRKSALEVQIELEKQIAEIRKQQFGETSSFFGGLFSSGLPGGGGTGRYLSNYFRGVASTIVGHAGVVLTTNPATGNAGLFNLGLPNQMLLGTNGDPTFLGKILQGTPFGYNPANGMRAAARGNIGGGIGSTGGGIYTHGGDDVASSTVDNTDATRQNTEALRQLTSSLGSRGGGLSSSFFTA